MDHYPPVTLTAPDKHPSFTTARETFAALLESLQGGPSLDADHAAVEKRIEIEGRGVMRQLFEGWCNLRANVGGVRDVTGNDSKRRTHHRGAERSVDSVFGTVSVTRDRVGARGADGRCPGDAALNLPDDHYTFGVRQRVAEEAARGSFDAAVKAVRGSTGAGVAKRQAEELTVAAATDVDAFYEETARADIGPPPGSLLVLSVDGKGIVMPPEGLREATRRAAAKSKTKLETRLSKGERANRKRMATVAAVYDIEPHPRAVEDVVGELDGERKRRPKAQRKRVFASVKKRPATVVKETFEEAARRDPTHTHRWVALVDGNKAQIQAIRTAAKSEGVDVTLVLDVIHVIEYVWKAAWDFFTEGAPAAEKWVRNHVRAILEGRASVVAAALRRAATSRRLAARKNADKAADYLLNNKAMMKYDAYLRDGLPIATGVIEGACRHLVKDRMDITGARWGLDGAEAVMQLRSLRSSGDLDRYWPFHRAREFERNHRSRYADTEHAWLARAAA